jgi:hypothetical protein
VPLGFWMRILDGEEWNDINDLMLSYLLSHLSFLFFLCHDFPISFALGIYLVYLKILSPYWNNKS